MKESFKHRAIENIESAELLFERGKFNASTNRAYYAAFHIAIAAICDAGIIPNIDHKTVNTLFSDNFFNRRKILPSKYKRYLMDLQDIRNSADYRVGVGRKVANQQLLQAKDFVEIILRIIR